MFLFVEICAVWPALMVFEFFLFSFSFPFCKCLYGCILSALVVGQLSIGLSSPFVSYQVFDLEDSNITGMDFLTPLENAETEVYT